MKLKNVLTITMLCLIVSSCIRDEALNVEAAIDKCSGSNILLASINSESKTVAIYVSSAVDLASLEIQFELADGASIEPVTTSAKDAPPKYDFAHAKIANTNGETLDQYQRLFKVTSESRTTEAIYTITVTQSELPTKYNFENLKEGNSKYHIFYEVNEMFQWASANPGFELTRMANSPREYPTAQTDGYKGKGVKLETKSTGSFGLLVKMPIAAGNLFIGSFDVSYALKDAKSATKFGFPFTKHPTRFEGYYKYKAGGEYTSGSENNKAIIDDSMYGKDKGDIYAILYKVNSIDDFLDGHITFDSPRIVSIAHIPSTEETDNWEHFDLPFEQRETINESDLATGKYKLAIVFSSSKDGASFKGSVGSTLWIDEVTIHTAEDNE